MSVNPFTADPAIRDRIEALSGRIGPALTGEIATRLQSSRTATDANTGSVLAKTDVDALRTVFGLNSVEELMLVALPAAQKLASPPISKFFVGAVGLEAESGDLIFGGNVEFVGTHLGLTLHGEGFVFTRAFSRGTSIAVIAIGEAHPCAHCRQYLSEFAAARQLMLIDPLGHRLTMAELYPWPFDPAYLGEPGIIAGAVPFPALELEPSTLGAPVAARLRTAIRRAHAPYSKCPASVVLTLKDGNVIAGSAIESVAFNPSIGPLQAAIVDLLAHGYGYDDIASAALATRPGGAVDYGRSVGELLAAIAPEASLTVVEWHN